MDGEVTMDEDREILRKVHRWYKDGRDNQSDWRKEAEEDYNFVAGNQWTDSDIEKLRTEQRPVITFNRIGPMISTVIGIEAAQRAEIRYVPREKGDTLLSDSLTELCKWMRESSDVPDEEAAAFEDMLICGLGWVETRMDYDSDLDGKFVQERVDPFEMYFDPNAKRRGLTDRKWQLRKKRMEPEEIKELWPDADISVAQEEEPDIPQTIVEMRDDDYGSATGGESSLPYEDTRPTVLHAMWFDRETIYRLQDPATGQMLELDEDEFSKVKSGLEQIGSQYVKQKRKVYRYAFVYGDTVLESGDSPVQTGWQINCLTGRYDRVKRSWYGLVRSMKDPQRWSNKFFSEILDIIHSNAKGGLLAEENAFVDARKAEEDWARSDSIIWLKSGSIAGQRVMNKPVAAYPQGLDRLLQFSVQSIRDVSGINLEMMGMANREQSGLVERIRKTSAYTVISTYFESLSRYRHESGIMTHEFMVKFLPDATIARVLSPGLVQLGAVQTVKGSDLKLTDIVVSESPYSEDNKAAIWTFLQTILPIMLKMGMPFPPQLLEYSPLPADVVEQMKQFMSPPAPQPMQGGTAMPQQPQPAPQPMQ